MKNILSYWGRGREVVANFGQATLHRCHDGRYELHGGSPADRAAAQEWASLFQHDAVFSVRRDESGRRGVSGTFLSRSRSENSLSR